MELDGVEQEDRLQPVGMIADVQWIGIGPVTRSTGNPGPTVLHDQNQLLNRRAPRTRAMSPVEITLCEPRSGWLWNKGVPEAWLA